MKKALPEPAAGEKRKAALHNLGCKVNAYETQAMQQMLEAAGFTIVPFHEKADVYVINTCSVTNMADRKSRQMLHRARRLNPEGIVVAAGCYAQTTKQQILDEGIVDIILGNNKKKQLAPMIEAYEKQRETAAAWEGTNAGEQRETAAAWEETAWEDANAGKQRETAAAWEDINDGKKEYEQLSMTKTAEHTRAFIKIQDGCNQFCSYCIIPYARGRVRSRQSGEILEEIRALTAAGCQEIVLTGIHLSSYGIDTEDSLLHLIQKAHEIEGIQRIRLGSLEPGIITEEFAAALAGMEKICPHFHLSLQSGCDSVLKRMNRRYSTAEYEARCGILRKYFKNPAITTDVIAGFPGETEEEFQDTLHFLEKIHFYEMHIFKYSKRKGTKAADMEGQVPEPVKQTRSAQLIALGERMSAEYREGFCGMEKTVLLEEPFVYEGKKYYTGYTKEYVKAAVESEKERANSFARGKITGQLAHDIYLMVEF